MNFTVNLHGQTALVTGAGAGVGRAAARALAAAGAAIVVNDINPDRAAQTAAEIVAAGGRAADFDADIANRFQAAALIEQGRDTFGRIHMLVNAAGVYKGDALARIDEWDWRRIVDVNLTGAFFCSQLLGRVMANEGGGVIVNIASAAQTLPQGAAYIAAKAGLIGLTRQCAREFAPLGIRVNAVCPAYVAGEDETRGMPLQGRLGTADEVAGAVLFLCSDAAAFITGQTIMVDGGGQGE
ncbi:MAG: SDR family oxidoreductase [Chloroflexi bacterium]|nr:SDR family oxidoreductase [Chloroflexota bacterium]